MTVYTIDYMYISSTKFPHSPSEVPWSISRSRDSIQVAVVVVTESVLPLPLDIISISCRAVHWIWALRPTTPPPLWITPSTASDLIRSAGFTMALLFLDWEGEVAVADIGGSTVGEKAEAVVGRIEDAYPICYIYYHRIIWLHRIMLVGYQTFILV